jgi:hypothetical protein
MRTILVTIAALAVLSGCRHDSSPSQQPAQLAQSPAPGAAPAPGANQTPAQPTATPSVYGTEQPVASPAPPPPQQAAPNPFTRDRAGRPESQAAPAPAPVVSVVIPSGTLLRVRMEQTVDTRRNRAGDRFDASLIAPIVVDGNTILPRGTPFTGHVTEARPSGRLKGRAVLGVELDSFRLNGVDYPVETAADTRVSGRHRKRNLILIGGGSGVGAAIGAIAGGPAGALIGAGAGAGAGTAGAFFTGKKNVSLPVETALSFRLRRSVEVR